MTTRWRIPNRQEQKDADRHGNITTLSSKLFQVRHLKHWLRASRVVWFPLWESWKRKQFAAAVVGTTGRHTDDPPPLLEHL
eukprot:4809658-Pyramimonas_sp.AAC.1